MDNLINVVGMDPSMRNWAIVLMQYNLTTGLLIPSGETIITTKPSTVKSVRVNSKDLETAEQLFKGVYDSINMIPNFSAMFVEVPVGSQSSRAQTSYAMCVGHLGALRHLGINFIEITPSEVKFATIGKLSASKDEIMLRAIEMYPTVNWPTHVYKGKELYTKDACNHIADAIGAIEAGIKTTTFRNIIQLRTN